VYESSLLEGKLDLHLLSLKKEEKPNDQIDVEVRRLHEIRVKERRSLTTIDDDAHCQTTTNDDVRMRAIRVTKIGLGMIEIGVGKVVTTTIPIAIEEVDSIVEIATIIVVDLVPRISATTQVAGW